ncbi:MAG: hypothetical protein GY869_18515, partial [Planctomycetes bacterium]|nr:hypothetical protein [Planctomycetota bacterium]
VQVHGAGLDEISGLAAADGNFIVGDGANWITESGAAVRASIGLGNVDNISLPLWPGSTNITTLGAITTGVWQGTSIEAGYIDWTTPGEIGSTTPAAGKFTTFSASGAAISDDGLTVKESGAVVVNGGLTINESGSDVDMRVEGISDPNLFYVDAEKNRVGIGTATPGALLDINGTTKSTRFYAVDTQNISGGYLGNFKLYYGNDVASFTSIGNYNNGYGGNVALTAIAYMRCWDWWGAAGQFRYGDWVYPGDRTNLGVIGSVNSNDGLTNIGVFGGVEGANEGGKNIGGYFKASGGSQNYGLIVAEGNVGIGVANPYSKLSVNGIIESTKDGIKFPDGTVQTTSTESCLSGQSVTMTAGETINCATNPVPVFIAREQTTEKIHISQESVNNYYEIHDQYRYAQTFTTASDFDTITKVELLITKKEPNVGYLLVEFYSMTDNSLASVIGQQGVLSTEIDVNSVWVQFSFPDEVKLSPSTQYAIVASYQRYGGPPLYWNFVSTDKYSGGILKSSSDGGTSWQDFPNRDFCFRVHGRKNPYDSFEGENGKIYSCNASDSDKVNFLGFATTSSSYGEDINVQYNGVVTGFSGLETGANYYIQDDGNIGTSPGTYEVMVGIAISESELIIRTR